MKTGKLEIPFWGQSSNTWNVNVNVTGLVTQTGTAVLKWLRAKEVVEDSVNSPSQGAFVFREATWCRADHCSSDSHVRMLYQVGVALGAS